nr:MAG TPA: hypothetical protein [Crassvirales sp.]
MWIPEMESTYPYFLILLFRYMIFATIFTLVNSISK